MTKEMDRDNYCKDCKRSIYGEYKDCDVNIENNGKYVGQGVCYCKCDHNGMVETYSWNKE